MTIPNPKIRRKALLQHQSFAFLIGINDYPKIGDLHSPINDVNALAKVLKEEQGFDHVAKLLNPNADQIRHFLKWIKKEESATVPSNMEWVEEEDLTEEASNAIPTEIGEDDYVTFYFAGHGVSQEISDNPDHPPVGFLIPSDAGFDENLIEMKELFSAFDQTNCKHLLLILDCCFAGSIRYISSARSMSIKIRPFFANRFETFLAKKSRQVLVSAGPSQKAADFVANLGDRNKLHLTQNGHSPFAYALINALKGEAELYSEGIKKDGIITPHELIIHLKREVIQSTALTLDQAPEYFPIGGHGGGDFIFLDPTNPDNFTEWNPINPYKGLASFEPEDHAFFHGRSNEIKAVVAQLDHLSQNDKSRLLFVSAPSAYGKSSLIKAGVYPALKQHLLETEKQQVQFFYSCPGTDKNWLYFQPDLKEAEEKNTINIGEGFDQLRLEMARRPEDHNFLLIDQFEEVAINYSKTAIHQFNEEIIQLLEDFPRQQLSIVITLRSNYEWIVQRNVLGRRYWKEAHVYHLPAMELSQLREAIVKPATTNWFEFDEKLEDRILSEVKGSPGALPLLSLMMHSLYEASNTDERIFKWAIYDEKLKGINGTLCAKADKVVKSLNQQNPAYRWMMRNIFLRMVQLEDGSYTRRRVLYIADSENRVSDSFHELQFSDEKKAPIVKLVINALVKNQLVTQGKDAKGFSFIEPAHDCLIHHWNSCKNWIAFMGDDQILQQRNLWNAVKEHHEKPNKKKKRFLWDEHPDLGILNARLNFSNHSLNQHEEAFIRKSVQRRERKKQRYWIGLIATAVALALLATFSFYKMKEAEQLSGNLKITKKELNIQETALKKAKEETAVQTQEVACQKYEAEIQEKRVIKAKEEAEIQKIALEGFKKEAKYLTAKAKTEMRLARVSEARVKRDAKIISNNLLASKISYKIQHYPYVLQNTITSTMIRYQKLQSFLPIFIIIHKPFFNPKQSIQAHSKRMDNYFVAQMGKTFFSHIKMKFRYGTIMANFFDL